MNHPLTECEEGAAHYSGKMTTQRGQWYRTFRCPWCDRETRQIANFLTDRRTMACDGKWHKILKPKRLHCSECGATVYSASPDDREAGVMCLQCAGEKP